MNQLIAQAECIGHTQIAVRQHGCLQPVTTAALVDHFRQVSAERHDRYTPPVELRSKFFLPSP